ncbi:MAG TPA: SGNH/GDSL hydrolase family protein [Thermoanaerobaculia bacterium]|nr:SGNH/GDSL hydrolase family protein [Thermoanaerobaculia bacterium]
MTKIRFSLLTVAFSLACSGFTSSDARSEPAFQNPARDVMRFGATGPVLVYVVLGDSTAAGQGAEYESGIAVGTARELSRTHRVEMTNLGVSGAKMSEVLTSQLGAAERLRSDLVLVSAAANDVTHLTSVGSVRQSLESIIRHLKAANPAVAIVVTGSPDMGSAARIPALLRPLAGRRTVQTNEKIRSLATETGVTFAPIAEETGPLFRKDRSLFAADRFHPNARGYATWIPVLNRAIAEALANR